MRRILIALATLMVLGLAVLGYTRLMAQIGSGTPPAMAAMAEQADRIHVDKAARSLILWRDGQEIRRYVIALGAAPEGHKAQEGDQRTPEGSYLIDWRNPNSIAHLSLHISCPDAADAARAAAAGVDPGGAIMIMVCPMAGAFLAGCIAYMTGRTAASRSPMPRCARSGRWSPTGPRSPSPARPAAPPQPRSPATSQEG